MKRGGLVCPCVSCWTPTRYRRLADDPAGAGLAGGRAGGGWRDRRQLLARPTACATRSASWRSAGARPAGLPWRRAAADPPAFHRARDPRRHRPGLRAAARLRPDRPGRRTRGRSDHPRDHGRPGEVTLVAIAPLTNVALAIRKEPRIVQAVREVIIMGGALRVDGNTTSLAEFNFFVDPHAAHIVLHSGMPITLLPWDITKDILLMQADVDRLTEDQLADQPLHRRCDPLLYRVPRGLLRLRRLLDQRSGRARAGVHARPGAHRSRCIVDIEWPAS